ncbi:MAG: hypothetical protein AMS27_00820 [Bacteroides sp. SM23_62_1]|nr:MAG: hypothetical protein AMS27_00820 [Bacteroides sp. SM23_62_1]
MGKKIFLSIPVKLIAIFLAAVMFSGCASDKQRRTDEDFGLDSTEISEDLLDDIGTAKQIFYSLPSPLETAMLLKSAGATYNEELLNPVSNTSNYTTNRTMALNLGIYTTDLSFASLFDQTQTSIDYMNAAKQMADGLGILDAIDNNTIERLEENINNRDVIMDIISETIMSSSSFLTENERPALASIVLVGGWIEGLYIATSLVGDSPIEDNKLVERIVDQKLSFEWVLKLLEDNQDHPDVIAIMEGINDLKSTFDKITITTSKIQPVPDEESNVTILKSESTIRITPAIFNELSEKIRTLRQNFIS